MRKFSVVWMMIGILVLAACSTSTDPKEDEKKDDEVAQEEETPESDEEDESLTSEDDEEEETSKEDEDNVENTTEGEESDQESNDSSEGDDPIIADDQEQLMDLGYEILHAQNKEDYAFLESILAKGTSMDKEANMFSFDDAASPHEQEFIKASDSEIEYRYMHEEDDDTIIVGFAIVDYEAESSFTIDFVFVQENGEWKMNDMDMNA